MASANSSAKLLTPGLNSRSNVSILSQQGARKIAYGKWPNKGNASILNFFKKVEVPNKEDESLFLSQGSQDIEHGTFENRLPSPGLFEPSKVDDVYNADDSGEKWYSQSNGLAKRRRLNDMDTSHTGDKNWDTMEDNTTVTEQPHSLVVIDGSKTHFLGVCTPTPLTTTTPTAKPKVWSKGPFLIDSDSEEDTERVEETRNTLTGRPKRAAEIDAENQFLEESFYENGLKGQQQIKRNKLPEDSLGGQDDTAQLKTTNGEPVEEQETLLGLHLVPILTRDGTIYDEFNGFEAIESFPEDDEFSDGEEFAERKWMEEQTRLYTAEDEFDDNGYQSNSSNDATANNPASEESTRCPVCDESLCGLNDDQASRHVNGCLDGNPIPIPDKAKPEPTKVKLMPPGAASRFSKAAIPRPGQANPFALDGSSTTPSSAFSKLMSSHAEDAAWANAAAAENAARRKPAYQRTCPFYKIMPGLFICVDAFRYGSVQGCSAYFLSHFHSDHYVGLTSSWCHGPIYCSKVTANLVKQQLRVDPNWVVPLQFETRTEVPDTQGVTVTMIPANHCPGSSLFLFEKVVEKGTNPRVQRILHCGDFRACPAHVSHPLLMADIVDSITGKTKQQRIDVCYLDTTYLNPRYAFPSQEDVIKACADMCVSLKERAEESDTWETIKKERVGSGMAKFINTTVKQGDNITMGVDPTKARGKLLVVCGTYSIGKERICMGIAKALGCKIWAPPGKQRICAALEDPELMSRLTDDPREAQIHMQMLMEIRAETLQDYLEGYKPHFSRVVGFRPSGWNYRPPNSR
jgi:DNA cross-link repair 1A protein